MFGGKALGWTIDLDAGRAGTLTEYRGGGFSS